MKKLFYLAALLISLQVSFVACKKSSSEEPAAPAPTSTVSNESIAQKWSVGSNSGRVQSTEYLYFEFTKDYRYIVTRKNNTPLYGSYTISADKKTITMNNFGVLTITSFNSSNFNFTLVLTGTTTPINIFTTVVAATVQAGTRTDLICRGWKLNKTIKNDTFVTSYPNSIYSKMELVMTKNGTYFVTAEMVGTGGNPGATSYLPRVWKWKDANMVNLCYGDTQVTCNGVQEVIITELTTGSLKMKEVSSNTKYECSPL